MNTLKTTTWKWVHENITYKWKPSKMQKTMYPASTHTCIQPSVHLQAHMQAHTYTHTLKHTETHTQDRMRAHAKREKCTFNLTSLLGHTSAEPKKLGTGMHAPEDGICYNILITSRQHPLQSTYIVPFLDITAIPKKKTCYLCMAFLSCS